MNQKTYELLRKGQFFLLIATGLAPGLLYTYGVRGLPLAWPIIGLYLLFAWVALLLPKLLRWCCAVLGAMAILWLSYRSGYTFPDLWGMGFALALLLGVPVSFWGWDEELPKGLCWTGFALHGIIYFLCFKQEFEGSPLPASAVWSIGICFLCFVLLSLLSMNRSALVHAALGRHRASPAVRQRNLLTILAFFGLTGLVAFSPALSSALYYGIRWLLDQLTKLVNRPAETYYEPVGDVSFPREEVWESLVRPDRESASHIETGGTPWAAKGGMTPLLWVFCILAAILVIMALWVLLRFVIRLLKDLSHPGEESYVDEITSLRPTKVKKKKPLPKQEGEENWGRLSPVWKIRRRYARLMKKNRWGSARTARENLPTATANLYEQARYSGTEVTAQQAEQFLKETK